MVFGAGRRGAGEADRAKRSRPVPERKGRAARFSLDRAAPLSARPHTRQAVANHLRPMVFGEARARLILGLARLCLRSGLARLCRAPDRLPGKVLAGADLIAREVSLVDGHQLRLGHLNEARTLVIGHMAL